jgi:hypothetical protein
VRIRDFLAYVCERTLENSEAEIHEQEIGRQVFGRPTDYDTQYDNIVRVTASNTRKKLEQYFASEGMSEQIILEIPKGKYTPTFRERDLPDSENVRLSEHYNERKLAIYRRVVLVVAACALLLGVYAAWSGLALRRERSAHRSVLEANPALNALWSQLLVSTGHTDIVVTDSSLSLFDDLLNQPITLAEYLTSGQWSATTRLSASPDLKTFAQHVARRGVTSMSSVTTAYRIGLLASGDQGRISILRPRDLTMTQMKSDNVILLGSGRANPWEELIDSQLNFQFGFEQKSSVAYYENRDPRPGEAKSFRAELNLSYCRVAFVPNLGGTGNVLSISGTDIGGTEGGGEFVTSERSVEELRALTGRGHGGRLPYFEALLKSRKAGGEGGETGSLSIVAFRLILPAVSGPQVSTAGSR